MEGDDVSGESLPDSTRVVLRVAFDAARQPPIATGPFRQRHVAPFASTAERNRREGGAAHAPQGTVFMPVPVRTTNTFICTVEVDMRRVRFRKRKTAFAFHTFLPQRSGE
jgi:hypothetical protein